MSPTWIERAAAHAESIRKGRKKCRPDTPCMICDGERIAPSTRASRLQNEFVTGKPQEPSVFETEDQESTS